MSDSDRLDAIARHAKKIVLYDPKTKASVTLMPPVGQKAGVDPALLRKIADAFVREVSQ